MLWVVWLPVVLIGLSHYATGPQHHWVHDILRRLYYVPILFAAFSRGFRGGVAVAVVCSLTYAPHAFFVMEASQDPGTTLNKLLEIVLYNTIGALAGLLADREAGRRRQAERACAEQRRMADQLIRAGRLAALGELVAGIAHEIKNPLHTIKGTAEIVDDIIPRDAEQARMWHLLRQEIDRLERIAERFLSFARPSKPDLRRQAFSEVYERVGELLRAQIHRASGVQLEVIPLSVDLTSRMVRVDRDQLAQVALNIASNALRAMGGHGGLRMEAGLREEESARFITLRLANDGPIIADPGMERIFDPFCTRSDSGTGLGLPIAERIAEAHGGFLEVENTGHERGVAFTLVLPEASEEPAAQSRTDPSESHQRGA
jgi:signal transduction histidine kinase